MTPKLDIRPPVMIPASMHDLFWERFGILTEDGRMSDHEAYRRAVDHCIKSMREKQSDMEA